MIGHNEGHRSEVYAQALRRMTLRYECLVQALSIFRHLDRIEEAGGSIDCMARQVLDTITMGFAAENCSILLVDEHRQHLTIRAAFSPFEDLHGSPESQQIRAGWKFSMGEGIVGLVAESGEPIRLGDVSHHRNFLPIPQSPVEVKSLLCFPLRIEGQVAGVLNLSHSQPNFFTEENEHTLSLIAERVARLLCDETLRQRIRQTQAYHSFVLEAVNDCVIVLDPAGRVLEANPAAQRLLEQTHENNRRGDNDLTKQWLDLVHTEDRYRFRLHLERAVHRPERSTIAFRVLLAGGTQRQMDMTIEPIIGEGGAMTHFIAVAHNLNAAHGMSNPVRPDALDKR